MGAVEQLVGLLSMEQRAFHEQLIIALYHLIVENEQAQAECLRPELALRSLLVNRKHSLEGKEEYQVGTACHILFTLLFLVLDVDGIFTFRALYDAGQIFGDIFGAKIRIFQMLVISGKKVPCVFPGAGE